MNESKKNNKKIKIWLIICAFSIIIMIVIGGLTRLTGSGLSMVNWKPLTGWIPPISDQSWQKEFDYYKSSPQFHLVNSEMVLSGFKKIYFLEFLHRFWGRLIGLTFFIPFMYFLVKGYLNKRQVIQYSLILFLGGLQGVLGWYMVKSGLIDIPRVSPYRLTAHLLLALFCYLLVIYEYLKLTDMEAMDEPVYKNLLNSIPRFFFFCLFIQIAIGGCVAGLEAGRGYNTFPLMNGKVIPEGLFLMQPIGRNFFENPVMVQFLHRIGGWLVVVLGCIFVVSFWKERKLRFGLCLLLVVFITQFALGVSTLLMFKYEKPILLASLHQLIAVILLTISFHLHCKIFDKRLFCIRE